ncbi:branched-chain amino acid ABC transporter permease [Caenimonas terrae]|uniref:Branched-chain amino acid ABC transporter permease n=1 Tax=Caenimonas terrae TaxID=696074 RepID=A0ABW0NHG8_9BURK
MSRRSQIVLGCLAALTLLLAPLAMKPYGIYVMTLWVVMTIAAVGLNLTLGYAGQISLAQAAFVGVGAYSVAILMSHGGSFWLGLLLAVGLCLALGWLLGYPALRVQHHYLAFVTLSFSTLAYLVFRNEEWLTGGTYGLSGIKRPMLLWWKTDSPYAYYLFCLAALAVVTALVAWIVRSPWGRAFTALRENPVRASSLGVDTRRYTLMAFAIGSTLGGVAGALYAPLVQFVDPSMFILNLSLSLLLMVIVGGAGFFFGPYLGALVAVLLPEWLRFSEGMYLIVYALLVMVLLAFCPTGLLGLLRRGRSVVVRRTHQLAPEPAPPAEGEGK